MAAKGMRPRIEFWASNKAKKHTKGRPQNHSIKHHDEAYGLTAAGCAHSRHSTKRKGKTEQKRGEKKGWEKGSWSELSWLQPAVDDQEWEIREYGME